MELKTTRQAAPLPSHCDTPLTLNNARRALLTPAPGQIIKSNNPCRREFLEMNKLITIPEPNCFEMSKFQQFLLNDLDPKRSMLDELEFFQSIKIAKSIYNMQVRTTLNHLHVPCSDPNILNLTSHPLIMKSYMIKAFFEEAVIMSSYKSVGSGSWWKRPARDLIQYRAPGLDIIVGKNLMVAISGNLCALVSRDHLTILSDLAAQRHNIYVQAVLNENLGYDQYPSPDEVETIILNGDKMLSRAGNDAYKLIYGLESSCNSRFIGDFEGGDWSGSKFRGQLLREFTDASTRLQLTDLACAREDLLTSIFNRSPTSLSQIYGLYRIWGHPTIEPLLGVIALKSKGTTPRLTLASHSLDITNKFKEDFIMRYINRHREWPPLDVSRLAPLNPIRVHYERKIHYPSRDPRYKREHLNLVKLLPTFPVDPKFDLIEFVDDKALSLNLPELIEEITNRKGIGSSLARSLLLTFLQSDISDPKEFLEKIDREGFPFMEICMGVHEKEREGNF